MGIRRGWLSEDAVREARALVRLALPVALSHLGMIALGAVDVLMVGHLSPEALAAVALGNTFAFAVLVPVFGAVHVLDPLVAQAHGAGDRRGQSDALNRGLVLCALLALPVMLVYVLSGPLLLWLSDQPSIVADARGYVRALAPGVPAYLGFVALRQSLQARSVVRPVMIAVLTGNGANVFLNLALVYGRFGFPALGPTGTGVASSLCRWLMLAVLALLALPRLREFWSPPRRDHLCARPLLPLLVHGLQIGMQMALEVWMFNAVAFLMVRMGTLQGAGHVVAMNLASISFMVPLGVGAAAATRVGNAVGRSDLGGARLAAGAALTVGCGVMLVSAALFLAFPRQLAALYSDDAAVIAMAASLLPLAGAFQVFDGLQAVGCGVLRGAGDTRAAAWINFVGYWLVGLPAGCALAYAARLGPRGLWSGLVLGLLLVAVLILLRIRSRIGVHGAALRPLAERAAVSAGAATARGENPPDSDGGAA